MKFPFGGGGTVGDVSPFHVKRHLQCCFHRAESLSQLCRIPSSNISSSPADNHASSQRYLFTVPRWFRIIVRNHFLFPSRTASIPRDMRRSKSRFLFGMEIMLLPFKIPTTMLTSSVDELAVIRSSGDDTDRQSLDKHAFRFSLQTRISTISL